MEKIILGIKGMSCKHCVKALTTELEQLKSASNVIVTLDDNSATLEYDPNVTTVEAIHAAVVEAGFEVA
jgi:Copper chaperone